jgi:ABC-type amino acid transport substrate-binding protein
MRSLPLLAVSTVLTASTALLSACAAPPTYLRPDLTPHDATAEVQSTQANILGAAVVALAADGYPIASVDNATGVVSTAPRPVVVTSVQADCGKERFRSRSADPLEVNDPDTYVAFTVLARQDYVEVRATVEDRRNPIDVKTPLICTSRGVLEQAMLNDIRARL